MLKLLSGLAETKLKLSPRCWNEELDKNLKKMEFKQATSDTGIYTASGGEVFLIAVYVDDIIFAGKTEKPHTMITSVGKPLEERTELYTNPEIQMEKLKEYVQCRYMLMSLDEAYLFAVVSDPTSKNCMQLQRV
eukprot:gene7369-13107_t